MFEQVLAAAALAVCALLFARLLAGAQRRRRLDAALARGLAAGRRRARGLWRWRSSRREAARMADEAIRRARERREEDGEWEGNVYRPKSFRGPRKPH